MPSASTRQFGSGMRHRSGQVWPQKHLLITVDSMTNFPLNHYNSIECAQRIRNGTADMGIFSAESMLQLSTLAWGGITVVKELRHQERTRETVDYRSVVVVSARHQGGVDGLRDKKFCHPGLHYGRQQRWSELFLKYFERLVVPANCADLNNAAEIETAALSNYFQSACRPGKWSNVPQEDAELSEYRYSFILFTLLDVLEISVF